MLGVGEEGIGLGRQIGIDHVARALGDGVALVAGDCVGRGVKLLRGEHEVRDSVVVTVVTVAIVTGEVQRGDPVRLVAVHQRQQRATKLREGIGGRVVDGGDRADRAAVELLQAFISVVGPSSSVAESVRQPHEGQRQLGCPVQGGHRNRMPGDPGIGSRPGVGDPGEVGVGGLDPVLPRAPVVFRVIGVACRQVDGAHAQPVADGREEPGALEQQVIVLVSDDVHRRSGRAPVSSRGLGCGRHGPGERGDYRGRKQDQGPLTEPGKRHLTHPHLSSRNCSW
jgi:hypothetical protein